VGWIVCIILISGCATLGPKFAKIEKVPDGTALVYIYRPSSIMGMTVSYDVKVGEKVIATLHDGGYFPYYVKPGELELWAKTETRAAVTLRVKAGEVHYVKGTVGVGFFVYRPHLTPVPTNVGESEIVECKLISEQEQRTE
jgi:hypothetical protein